jgi:hypothetical protein
MWLVLRAEVAHPASLAHEIPRLVPDAVAIRPLRSGEFDVSEVVVVGLDSPKGERRRLRLALTGHQAEQEPTSRAPDMAMIRTGWAFLADLVDAADDGAWQWDRAAHDCTEHAIEIRKGLLAFGPGPDDDWLVGGCDPRGPDHACRVCGYRWGGALWG